MKAIQDNNLLYNTLSPLVQFGTRCHYQSFVVKGEENLPKDGAYIIAPCHQQALMEPLAVLNFAPKPPVYLARADIFAKPTIRAILTFLKILPVYRQRDGQRNLDKNNQIFDLSRDVLLDGYPLCLMAEGRHNDRHHLLNMGKGMFRIAGETQIKLGDHPLFIVPTGIDFDEYERPYANVVVNIGKPIPVQPYMEQFRENEPVALNEMRKDLAVALSPLMHDIRHEEYYDEILTLSQVLNRTMRQCRDNSGKLANNAWNRFLMRQKISQQLDAKAADPDEKYNKLMASTRQFISLCKELHMRPVDVAEHRGIVGTLLSAAIVGGLIAAIIMVPAVRWSFFFFLLCFPILFIPTHLLMKRLIADPQFRSSVNFGVRFLFSIIYGIIIAIVIACGKGFWMNDLLAIGPLWGLVAVGVIYLGAISSASIVNGLKSTGNNLRYWLLKLLRHRKMKKLQEIFLELKDYFK